MKLGLLIGAVVMSLVAAILAFAVSGAAGAGACLLAAASAGAALALERQPAQTADEALLNKVTSQIDQNRKLVIYERETGLLAHWYLTLRGEEECSRAQRYTHPLALLVTEPSVSSNGAVVGDQLADWLRRHLRNADLAGYLGHGRYAVVMPETGAEGAVTVERRLRDGVPDADVALAHYPDDGSGYDDIYGVAAARLTSMNGRRAA